MMLDILIINDSNGKNCLRQVMMELKKKYGPSKPFNDDDLIPEITAMTSSVIGDFFKKYIVGTATPLYQDYFNMIGYSYSPVFVKSIYYFGRFGANYDENKNQFFFNQIEGENAFGIENKDIIVSVDNNPVTMENLQATFVKYFFENSTIPNPTVVVLRNGKQLKLTGTPQNGTRKIPHYITVAPNIDSKSTANFNKFIGKAQ
jgi:predicted metalloprotease with PDZ domain